MLARIRPYAVFRNPRRVVFLASFSCSFILAPACATPTALTLTIFGELACDKGSVVALVGGGGLEALPFKAPSSVSTTCDAAGRRGNVVVLPTASNDESVAFAVIQRADGQPADGCLDPKQSSGCIVAKRQLRFAKHASSEMRIDLRLSCLGITCDTNETCVKGRCLDAQTTCGAACDETALEGRTGGANPDNRDASADDASELNAIDSGAGTRDATVNGDTTCALGDCVQVCAAESNCSRDCIGGGCTQICSRGATCDFTCSGKNCTQRCDKDASCKMRCDGSTDGSATCAQSCTQAVSCQVACTGVCSQNFVCACTRL